MPGEQALRTRTLPAPTTLPLRTGGGDSVSRCLLLLTRGTAFPTPPCPSHLFLMHMPTQLSLPSFYHLPCPGTGTLDMVAPPDLYFHLAAFSYHGCHDAFCLPPSSYRLDIPHYWCCRTFHFQVLFVRITSAPRCASVNSQPLSPAWPHKHINL